MLWAKAICRNRERMQHVSCDAVHCEDVLSDRDVNADVIVTSRGPIFELSFSGRAAENGRRESAMTRRGREEESIGEGASDGGNLGRGNAAGLRGNVGFAALTGAIPACHWLARICVAGYEAGVSPRRAAPIAGGLFP